VYRQYVQSGIAPGANTVTTSAIAANTIQPWQLSSSLLNPTVNSFTGDGTTTSFTLTSAPASANTVVVTVNGITQSPVTNYSTNNTSLIFTSAPANASVIRAVQQAMIGTSIVPIDGSVTTSKLGSSLTLSGNTTFSGAISGTSATLSGILGVTGVTTLTAQPILSSLTASSAVATDASKGLVSVTNTGSGNNVLSASPTLTGTVAAASLSLSSLTSGRVTYANTSGLLTDSANLAFTGTKLGIGTNTPSELLHLKVSSGDVYLQLQSVANQVYVGFETARTVGVIQSTNALTFDVGSSYTERMRITSAGNVGIGTSSPQSTYKLTVSGTDTTFPAVYLENTTNSKAYSMRATGTSWIIRDNTAGLDRITLDTSGNVGIGTSSLSDLLTVQGTIRTTDGTNYAQFANNFLRSYASGTFYFDEAVVGQSFVWRTSSASSLDTTALTLTSSGILGIGVTPSPWGNGFKALEVGYIGCGINATSNNQTNVVGNAYGSSGWKYSATGYASSLYQQNGSGSHAWSYAAAGTAGNAITWIEAMQISTSGNVGIGTSSPSTKLHVEQSTTGDAFKVARGGNYIIMGGSGSGTQYIKGYEGVVAFGNEFAGATTFLTSNTERMRIDSSGKLLVGCTNDNGGLVQLQKAGSNSAGSGEHISLRLNDNGNYATMRLSTSGNLCFDMYGAGWLEAMRITGAGNVGIGTSSPAAKLHIAVADASVDGTKGVRITNPAGTQVVLECGVSSDSFVGTTSASAFSIRTSNTERMRIDYTGLVGIGETSPQTKLHMTDGTLRIDGTTAQAIYIRGGATIKPYITINEFGTRQWDIGAGYYSAGTFSIQSNQTNGVYLGGTATAWASASDERLKDIIEPITNAVTKVSNLRSVIGKYKTDEEGVRRSFLIAQDIQAHFPEALESSDPDKLGVQYTDVIPLLVAAIKEQQALIESLTTTVNSQAQLISSIQEKLGS
jgi:hypothetical protein